MVAQKEEKEEPVILSAFEQNLMSYVRALQPGILIQSLEEARVFESIVRVVQYFYQQKWSQRSVLRWSVITYQKYMAANPNKPEKLKRAPLLQVLDEFVTATVPTPEGPKPEPSILVLHDIDTELRSNATLVRAIREVLWSNRQAAAPKCIIFTGKAFTLPPEIMADFAVLDYELPTPEEVKAVFDFILPSYPHVKVSDEVLQAFSSACAGLTMEEARQLFNLSLIRYANIDERSIQLALREKAQIVKRTGILEVSEPKVSFEDVGGLEHLKSWVSQVSKLWRNPAEAESYGSRIPSGVLLTGVPGTGKSRSVEALAKLWQVSLLKFDVGRAYGGIVGQSEANIRQMIQTAKAVAPCIVHIDEIEKALGGDSLDGGTTGRVKSTLLTWLQDKPANIFVAATGNDLTKLMGMSELIRAGRIDTTFFVDLPNEVSRKAILAIHLRLTGHPVEEDDPKLSMIAQATYGFSGAELERVVQTALRASFNMEPRPEHPSLDLMLEIAKRQTPLSKMMRESIVKMREWVKEGRAEPAGALLESDEKPAENNYTARKLPLV